MTRKRLAQLVVLVAGLAVFLVLSRRWPRDHTLHFVLGDVSPRVTELSMRIDEPSDRGEPLRVATFRYGDAGAPRIVTEETRLADGDYAVEFEVASHSSLSTVRRMVKVEGSTTITIDLSRELSKELLRSESQLEQRDHEAVPR